MPVWGWAIVVLNVLGFAVVFYMLRLRSKGASHTLAATHANSGLAKSQNESGALTGIAIVNDEDKPIVEIKAIQSWDEVGEVDVVDHTSPSISRLGALMQAAPAVLTAGAAQGKRLMEVVVNGDLVSAKGAEGAYRAMAMGPKGIAEHAKLFEVNNLQNIIKAGAIWQVASVIVAQKHLADISKKLDEIKQGIERVLGFLEGQRLARIQATYDYLHQAYRAIEQGELSKDIRHELENCERDMNEILLHLCDEYRKRMIDKVQHKETFGTEELTKDIGEKIDGLGKLGKEIGLCLKTRLTTWHVLSLYPGEHGLKDARRESIEKSITAIDALGLDMEDVLISEIKSIKSKWNRQSTLEERKSTLHEKLREPAFDIFSMGSGAKKSLARGKTLLQAHTQPSRLWLEYDAEGKLVGARGQRQTLPVET